jgi:hypothetical protein
MSKRYTGILAAALVMGGAAVAEAGQFKTLNTSGLGVGGQVTAYSSPKNNGSSMEMETYEWATASGGGTYRCRLLSNATSRALNIRLVGVNGTVINSCTTAAGGTCDAPSIGLAGGVKFQCLVATSFGTTIPSDASWYRMGVQRN